MRIRSIKPEFWRSADVAQFPRDIRLLFLGLWSYVDDNGVGIDDYRLIAADLFPLDDDQAETREFVRDGLARLSRECREGSSMPLIVRYEVNSKRLLAITGWKHQRIDKPGKPRFAGPSEEDLTRGIEEAAREFATVSRDARDTLVPGTGEQGNRGTGETHSPNAAILFAVPEPQTTGKPHAYSSAFEDAWLAYGRKGAKKTAYAEWLRAIKRAPAARIVAAIPAYVDSTPDPKYRKDFERWLKGDCWESAVIPVRQVNGSGYHPYRDPEDQSVYDEDMR